VWNKKNGDGHRWREKTEGEKERRQEPRKAEGGGGLGFKKGFPSKGIVTPPETGGKKRKKVQNKKPHTYETQKPPKWKKKIRPRGIRFLGEKLQKKHNTWKVKGGNPAMMVFQLQGGTLPKKGKVRGKKRKNQTEKGWD